MENKSLRPTNLPLLKVLLALGFFAVLGVLWQWAPVEKWLNVQELISQATLLQTTPWGLGLVLAGYTLGCVIAFPILALIIITALIFDPMIAFAYALIGTAAGAASTYAVGHTLGRDTVKRYTAGSQIERLSLLLAKRGIIAMAMVRWVPVAAPFTVVNMVAGASHIRFWDYMLGTLLGMLPVTLGLTLFADGIVGAFNDPQPANLVWVGAIVLVSTAVFFGFRRWIGKQSMQAENAQEASAPSSSSVPKLDDDE